MVTFPDDLAVRLSHRGEGRWIRVDRCALFVDAGYVLADGAMAVHGTRRRESVSWDYAGLLQLLASMAAEQSGLPLLRCYWYEATVEGRRGADHDTLADLPGVKLRLAKMRPGRREGVESEIHRDLATLAQNKAVSDAMIVSAEEDLSGVIADVQDLGMRVTMLHITVDGDWTISRALRQECDDIVEINAGHLRPYVELISGAEPSHADEADAPPASPAAPRRAVANGHGTASAAVAAIAAAPAVEVAASPAAPAAPAGDPPAGGDGRRPPFTTPSLPAAVANGADSGRQENGYHSNGYQVPAAAYPEPVPDYPRARISDMPGPGRQPSVNGAGPSEFAPAEPPAGPDELATAGPAAQGPQPSQAAQPPQVPQPPQADQREDMATVYPMPGHAAMAMPPQPQPGPAVSAAPAGPAVPGAPSAVPAEISHRPDAYPAPVPADAMTGQFSREWAADPRSAAPQYTDDLTGAIPGRRGYQAPDIPAYSPGAAREAAPDGARADVVSLPVAHQPVAHQQDAAMERARQPEPVPVPSGPGAQVRRLPNGYTAPPPLPPAHGQPPAYGGPQPVPGPPGVPGPPRPPRGISDGEARMQEMPGSQPGPGLYSVPGPQPAGPQHAGSPYPGPHYQAGAGLVPLGPSGPASGPVPAGPTPPSGPVPALPPSGGQPALNGLAPVSGPVPPGGLSQTSGLMAVAGGPPPGGPGLSPVQGPSGGAPGNPSPGSPAAPAGPGGPAGPPAHAFGGGQPQQALSLADAVQSAHEEGQEFGGSVARDAPALWLEAVLARKPRMPSDLEARLLQGSSLPIDFLLHDEVRHALRRGFWDALERARR